MRYSYDLHIHSALSPCAEAEMTPNNIINMAMVNGLDIIAVTDHNSAGNIAALAECAKDRPLLFIPGIEVESAEEVHISCLFAETRAALAMANLVKENLLPVKNNESVLGPQYIFDAGDNIISREEQMLLFPTELTAKAVFEAVEELNGCAYFSHIDRSSYSVLSVLGAFPDDIDSGLAEVSNTDRGREFGDTRADLNTMTLLYCSDAHRLTDISRGENFIELPAEREDITARDVIDWLKHNTGR